MKIRFCDWHILDTMKVLKYKSVCYAAIFGAYCLSCVSLTSFFSVRIYIISCFLQEECEELCQKIKDGVYKKLTIVCSLVSQQSRVYVN